MYGFTTALTGIRFDQALTLTIEALKGEGFGAAAAVRVADNGAPVPAV